MTATISVLREPLGGGGETLLDRLMLDRRGPLIFRSHAAHASPARLYGGEVAAQALVAAAATVAPDRRPHSLHAHYLAPGDANDPVDYEVGVSRDGRSFSSRTVAASQHGEQIFSLSASFQKSQEGVSHQLPAACPGVDLPGPEECADGDPERQAWADGVMRRLPVEMRFVDDGPGLHDSLGIAPRMRAYLRANGDLGAQSLHHAAGLVYLSDLLMISAALLPHELSVASTRLFTATITHSVWLHAQPRADTWLLYDVEGAWAGGGRTLSHGRLYDGDGFLMATTSQEGLVRYPSSGGASS